MLIYSSDPQFKILLSTVRKKLFVFKSEVQNVSNTLDVKIEQCAEQNKLP